MLLVSLSVIEVMMYMKNDPMMHRSMCLSVLRTFFLLPVLENRPMDESQLSLSRNIELVYNRARG